MINVFQPTLGEVELQKIKEVFDSNWIGKGKLVTEFEEKWAGDHPEFYDMDKLFEKASDADRERAKDAIEAAKETFGG